MAKKNGGKKLAQSGGGPDQDELKAILTKQQLPPRPEATAPEAGSEAETSIAPKAPETDTPEVAPEKVDDEAGRVSEAIKTEKAAAIAEQPNTDIKLTPAESADLAGNTAKMENLAATSTEAVAEQTTQKSGKFFASKDDRGSGKNPFQVWHEGEETDYRHPKGAGMPSGIKNQTETSIGDDSYKELAEQVENIDTEALAESMIVKPTTAPAPENLPVSEPEETTPSTEPAPVPAEPEAAPTTPVIKASEVGEHKVEEWRPEELPENFREKLTQKEEVKLGEGQENLKTEEELRQAEADEIAKRMREDEEEVIRAHEAKQNEEYRGILHPEGPQLGPASMELPEPIDETDAAYRQWGGNLGGKSMEEVKEFNELRGEVDKEKRKKEKETAKESKNKEKAPQKEKKEVKIEATDADFVEFTTRENIFARFIKNKVERLNNWGDRILGYETGGIKSAKYDLPSRIFTRFKNFFDNKLFGHRSKKAMKFEQYTNDANAELAEQQAVVDAYTVVRDDISRPWKERAKAQKQLFKAQKKLGKIKSERSEYITKLQKMEGLKEACHNRIVERSQDVANAVKERIDPYQERLDSAKLVIHDLRERMDRAGGELVDWQTKLDDLKLKYTSVPRAQRAGLKAAMADIKGEIKKRQQIIRETKKKIHTCSDKMSHLESLINPWSDLAGAYEDVAGRPVYWSEMRKGMFGDEAAPEPSERNWASRGVDLTPAEDQLELPADTEKISPQDYLKKYLPYLDSIRHLSSADLSEITKNLTGQTDLSALEKSIVDFYVKNGVAERQIKQRLATIRAMMAKKK